MPNLLLLLLQVLGALICCVAGLLYIFDKAFVRMVARQPAALDKPGGRLIRILVGCVLLTGGLLFGYLAWHGIATWLKL